MLLVAAGALALAAYVKYRQPLPLPVSPFEFDVRTGTPLATVARTLRDAGVIPHPAALTLLARVRGVDRTIKAGSYEIEQGITLPELLAKLTQGDVTQTAVTIVEGATFADVRRVLRAATDVGHEGADLPDAELLKRVGAVEASPEGILFPDTYFLAKGSSDLALLRRAYAALHQRLDAAWARRAPDLPLATPYDALILASIVEKETVRLRQSPEARDAAADRPHGHLRHGCALRWQPAQARSRDRHAVQHVHARRVAADADRIAVAGVARRCDEPAADGLPVFRIARRRHVGVLGQLVRSQSRRVKISERRSLIASLRAHCAGESANRHR